MSQPLPPTSARRFSVQALIVCVAALVAAVVAFSRGSWLGIIWILLAGLASNLAWYYHRRARRERGGD
ncbi:hypothetical protein [Streptomyces alkaliphilus]|uniref:Uncharacterized protein n=1 Tax=Streptomyces alkaliphilus TaxID=1472722 RepID=A0A7W3TAP9_9ACTN|nr:hypothetical protein [Streptomyces alkaliphilus]MBB0243322.1 hypothetical protein [Streptomyces alkaliphilus]MQS06733.1 hypothetical protein [Streptomyces alkaliphilus]